MPRAVWGKVGERFYEAGVDRGMLYVGTDPGVAWTGLVSVEESPTGAKPKPRYLDGIKFLNRQTNEEFEGNIEAYTYPDEFARCEGSLAVGNGLFARQQRRAPFGLAYRSKVGNDIDGIDHAYKINIVYDALAEPAGHTHRTLSDSDDMFNFSWHITTKPQIVAGVKPTANFVIDSRETPDGLLSYIEDILYGTDLQDPRLPSAGELAYLFMSFNSDVIDAGGPLDPAYYVYDGGSPTSTPTTILDGGTP